MLTDDVKVASPGGGAPELTRRDLEVARLEQCAGPPPGQLGLGVAGPGLTQQRDLGLGPRHPRLGPHLHF